MKAGGTPEHPAQPTSLLSAACPAGTFKASQGAGLCAPCPPNSRSSAEASPLCACRNGYFRADLDPPTAACTSEYRGSSDLLLLSVWFGMGREVLCCHGAVCGLQGVAAWASSLSFGEEGAKEGRKDCCSLQTGGSVSDGFSASKLPQKFTMEY